MTRTLIVEPRPIGHRAFYLSLIVQAMGGDDVSLLAPQEDPGILDHFRRRGLNPAAYQFHPPHGDIIAQVAELCRKHSIDKVFFAYMDDFLLGLLESSIPCPVSGIWFHPYALDRRYRWLPPIDKRLRLRRRIHHGLRRTTGGLCIERLYFLDPGAVDAMAKLNPQIAPTRLPDPWERMPAMTKSEARRHFELPDDRIIFLHIGSSEKRKGLSDVLAAFERLPSGAERDGMRPLLLRVGENDRLKRPDRERLDELVSQGMAKVVDGFVSEADFIEYFAATDWILLPYRSFRFSSGILSNAIAAGKPVIAADHGLIARMVRDQSLGYLFRHRSRSGLKRAIGRALTDRPVVDGPHADSMTPEAFIFRLRNHLSPHNTK